LNQFLRVAYQKGNDWRYEDQFSFQGSEGIYAGTIQISAWKGQVYQFTIETTHEPKPLIRSFFDMRQPPTTFAPVDFAVLSDRAKRLVKSAGYPDLEIATNVYRIERDVVRYGRKNDEIRVELLPIYKGFKCAPNWSNFCDFEQDGGNLTSFSLGNLPSNFIPPYECNISPAEALRSAARKFVNIFGRSQLGLVRVDEQPMWLMYTKWLSSVATTKLRFRLFARDSAPAVLAYQFVFSLTPNALEKDLPYGQGLVAIDAPTGDLLHCSEYWPKTRMAMDGSPVSPTQEPEFSPVVGDWKSNDQEVRLTGVLCSAVYAPDWQELILQKERNIALVEFSPSKQVLRERWKKEWKYQKLSRATLKALLAKPAR
jgi:hypothetical protein